MKQKLRLMMTMLLLAVMGSAWAVTKSVKISPTQALNDGGVSPINIVCAKGDGTSNPQISSGQLRLYQAASGKTTGNTITFSSEKTITSIVFTFASTYTASNGSFSVGSYDSSTSTWTGSTNSVTLTVTGTTSGTRIYISQMIVYYEDDSVSTLSVTYNSNGGDGDVPVDSKQYNSGATVTVLGPGDLSRDHYSFVNWNTSADGTGTSYSAGYTFDITANTVLYAQWSINSHNVTLPTADTYGTYTMSATNPVSYGTTVSLSYTPATGYDNYIATWSVNGDVITGSSFTMPDEDVTVTVSVKKVTTTSMIVDFENSTSSYPDWEFTNMKSQQTNANVTPHGGTYIGSTGGYATAYLRTKEKVNPALLTCYVSKQSTNTAPSTWYIQVSSNGSTWTDVTTTDATDMEKGEWKGFSADLSSYADVYVRVYYSGSTAIRNIDDLTLTVKSSSVATPTISLESGTYNTIQTANITCDTEGATIYYTTDGTDPTESSILYEGQITIGKSMTLKAIAILDDESSSIVSAEYVLKVATPVFSIEEGTYREAQTVTVTSATPGATIYYTTDGSEPTTNSAEYSGAISVTETTTIKAIAIYGEMGNSDVATATYTIKEPLSGDVFVKATSESDLEDGFEIIIVNDSYSKVMGEQRENNFGAVSINIDKSVNPYEAALEDDATTILTLEGQAGEWYFKDEEGNYLYTANTSSNALHTKNYKDNFTKATISFIGDNSDAVITFQGITTRNIVRYNNGNNALFSCYSSGQEPVQIYYRAPQQTISKPTITPATGTYMEPQTVTITNNAEGTTVYYTVDGTTPTSESTKYTTPFQLVKNGTYMVKAISIGADGSSRVSTSSITINIIVDAPVFTEADGTTFDEPYTIHLTAAEGTIYYTTGGSSPIDKDGNLNSSAIAYNASTGIKDLSNAVTINAVAIDQWGNVSVVSSASYKYIGEVTLPYYENFDEGLGNFTTHPTSTGSNNVKWEFATNGTIEDIEKYGEARKYARIKGGTNSSTSDNSYKKFVGNDYLVSPVIDMSNVTSATLNFIHGGHYFGSGYDTNSDGTGNLTAKKASCKLFVRDVTSGIPNDVTTGWTDITDEIKNWFYQQQDPASTSTNNMGLFPRVNSGDISLNAFVGQKIQIAFYFETDETKGGYWNVLKFAVTGTEADEENYEEVTMNNDGFITYVVQNDINWAGMRAKDNTDNEIPAYGYKVIEFSLQQKAAVLVEFGFGGDDTSSPEYSENIIPANTPIVLKGKQGVNQLLIAKSDDVIPSVKGNLLKPSYGTAAPSADQAFYVLQKQSGWTPDDPYNNYWFNRLRTGRVIEDPTKAYLNGLDMVDELTHVQGQGLHSKTAFYIIRPVPSDMVSEDAGIVDGIDNIEKRHMSDNEFYTISGVRVNHPSKGLYIMNGKKVIIK